MITTLIPTYRRPLLLKKAVESVLKQTYPHFQVCIYDNASGDETEDVVRHLMKQDTRIKYHCHSKNVGMMANYQYALSRIHTPYFSMLSDDDTLHPWFFETALQEFEKFPNIAFCAYGVQPVDEKGSFLGDPIDKWSREGYFFSLEGIKEMIINPVIPTSTLFQHKVVKDIQPDMNETIQMRWDSDFLLQMIVDHPFVIRKNKCSIFLSHPNGFSSGIYLKMVTSGNFSPYADATERIMKRLLSHPKLTNEQRTEICAAFKKASQNDFFNLIGGSFSLGLYAKALLGIKFSYKYCGFNKRLILIGLNCLIASFLRIINSIRNTVRTERTIT